MRDHHLDLIRTVASILVIGLLSTSATADEEPADNIWQTIFSGTTEVNVVNVDVAVTDADGRAVTGLTRADFELFENGQPVAISNFYGVENGVELELAEPVGEGEAAAPPAPAVGAGPLQGQPVETAAERKLHLILFVDDSNISEASRNRVFNGLREFLRQSWRADVEAMVAANERSLVIRQGFTGDLDEVLAAVAELERTAASSPRFDVDLRELIADILRVDVEAGSGLFATKNTRTGGGQSLDEAEGAGEAQEAATDFAVNEARALLPRIRAYGEQRHQHVEQTIGFLHQLVEIAAGLPGRKSVLYVSDGLPLRPAEALYEAFSRRFQALTNVGANVSADLEASREDATVAFGELVTRANTSGVTFYTLDAAPDAALTRGSAATAATAGGNFGTWDSSLDATEQRNRQESLQIMAEGTGGRFGLTPASFDAVFAGIFADFDNYYALGYVADRLERDKKRAIEVRLKDPGKGWQLRYRSSFRDKTAVEQAAERAQAALLLEQLDNPLQIALDVKDAEAQEDGNFVVPLLVRVPLGRLVLLPGEGVHQGQVSMFVAVRDAKGRTSQVNRHLCPIRIPNTQVLTALGQSATCGVRLLMRAGPQRIGVSVLDESAFVHSTTNLDLDVGGSLQAELHEGENGGEQ